MSNSRYCSIVAAGLALGLAVAGCGVKGRPLPPEEVQPERIVDLTARADKDGIRLSWPRPERYARGRTMRDLAGFIILRGNGDQPLRQLAQLPIADRERFQKVQRFDYVDTATEMGHAYRYALVATTDGGYQGDPSNIVEFTRIAPPPPANPENFALPKPSPIP